MRNEIRPGRPVASALAGRRPPRYERRGCTAPGIRSATARPWEGVASAAIQGAAVRVDDESAQIGRSVRRQKHHEIGHFLGLGGASER